MASSGAGAGQQPSGLSDEAVVAGQKRAAAEAAAELVEDGMRVGLGTGSTVAYLLDALAACAPANVRYVATSPETERCARALGLVVDDFDGGRDLDIVIDGADQVDPAGWLIKGGGGAHTREKIVAAAGRRFVVIVSAEKAVASLRPPVPLELLGFGVGHTLRALGNARLRTPADRDERCANAAPPPTRPEGLWHSPDGGLIADYLGAFEDPRELAARLSAIPGVVEHGLFPPELVSVILIAQEDGVRRRRGGKPD